MNEKELFLDIETVCTNDERMKKEIAESIKVPGNMSKAETIAKWQTEEKPKLIEEAISKTSLDGTYGRVVCITYAFGDEPVQGFIDRDEKTVLVRFFEAVIKNSKTASSATMMMKPTVIGHNVAAFDLRFLWQRAIINGIKPHPLLPWNEKAWSDNIRDTMVMWNPDKDKRISLHKLCLALGIESPKDKNDMDGSDIALLWKKREYDKILAYGIDDTEAMRQCYRRLTI
jgi:hypothetical protein